MTHTPASAPIGAATPLAERASAIAMRLIEPLGLLPAHAAPEAVAAGFALALAGAGAFTAVRLIDSEARLIAAADLPAAWRDVAARLAAPVPGWAGLPPRPAVMGIINVTPDSFSDGGRHLDPGRAAERAGAMVEAGAAMLDVGAESTRPGAAPVPPDEEQDRLLPVLLRLRHLGVPISVDTRNAPTMAAALDAGANIINDVSALTHDPEAAALIARRGCPVVLMHMRGTPATMMQLRSYTDVAVDVTRELGARVAAAEAAGIPRERIAIDPGIGFAKGPRQSLAMLARLPLLLNLGCRILVGVSRKGLIGALSGEPDPSARLPGSLAAGLFAVRQGAAILRAHDVEGTVAALRTWEALAGWVGTE